MRKIFLIICAFSIACTSNAQTIPNAGMENWRSNSTGSTTAVTINAPDFWYGFDSLLIADAETYAFIIGAGNYHAQLYQENTIVHSGTSSAKVITLRQDTTLGIVPGSLSNAKVSVDVLALLGGGSLATATTFNGGSPVNFRVDTVSAYIQYMPGIDSATGLTGYDTGRLTVQALGHIHGGKDTIVGTGGQQILPATGSFVQISANVTYWDTTYVIDTIRIIFSSSGGGASQALDSSTLYVDDVSMSGVPNPDYSMVNNVSTNNLIKVYPNPASGSLCFSTANVPGLKAVLYSVNGQVTSEKTLTGYDAMDVSLLPSGLYFYTVYDSNGVAVQRGKVSVNN